MTTREKLALAIRLESQVRFGRDTPLARHERLAKRAEAGYYDDYLSDLACPIVRLVKDATQMGLHTVAEAAKEGAFDGTKEEADAWAESEEGKAVFKELLEGR